MFRLGASFAHRKAGIRRVFSSRKRYNSLTLLPPPTIHSRSHLLSNTPDSHPFTTLTRGFVYSGNRIIKTKAICVCVRVSSAYTQVRLLCSVDMTENIYHYSLTYYIETKRVKKEQNK